MSSTYEPDHTVSMAAHLREFVEQWQTNPAAALACAAGSGLTETRAQELLDGADWHVEDVLHVGFAVGPRPDFWMSLWRNHKAAVAAGKAVVSVEDQEQP